jgi:SAM-dependent methyltransferase
MKHEFDSLFGALADDGWFPSPAHVMRRAAILDAFGGYPHGRLLEVGCGAGRLLVDWHKLGHSGQAIDPDPEARTIAAACTKVFDADFEVLEHPNGDLFDYIVATEVLEHLEEPNVILREWLTHLRPGGIFLSTVPAFRRLWGASDEWAGHVQRFEPEDFRSLLESAGLTVLKLRLYGYPIGNGLRILGNLASVMKMRQRTRTLGRAEATYASGRERRLEYKLAPLMRSLPSRTLLQSAIRLQRAFDRGHGLLAIAHKPLNSAAHDGGT